MQLVTGILAVLTLVYHGQPKPDPYPIHHKHKPVNCDKQRAKIDELREYINYMLDVMGRPRFPDKRRHYACSVLYRRGWVRTLWGVRLQTTRAEYNNPPNLSNWLCIHRYEGSWTDPNAPYYGGLQMDYTFMQEYAPDLLSRKGTADNWTWLEQVWTAEKARRSGRGYYPWPNTAHYCGLI